MENSTERGKRLGRFLPPTLLGRARIAGYGSASRSCFRLLHILGTSKATPVEEVWVNAAGESIQLRVILPR